MILVDQKTAARLDAADLPWKVRVENHSGSSNKFWEAESNGLQVRAHWGKISTRGAGQPLLSGAEALSKLSKKIRNRGYSYPPSMFRFPKPFDKIVSVGPRGRAFDQNGNKVLTLSLDALKALKVIVFNASGPNAPRITFSASVIVSP